MLSGTAAYTASNHPCVVDNVSLLGYSTNDVGHSNNFDTWWVTGGIYTQDVDEFCAEGYVCIPYEDTERTDDYIVVPGYHVKYFSVETVETTDAESGEVTSEIQTTLLKKYFRMLPRDKFWYEMDERANYFELEDDDGGVILTRNLLKQRAVSEIDNKFAIILSDGAPNVTVNSDTDTVGTIKSSFWGDQLDMNGKRYQIRRNGGGWTHPDEVDRTLKYLATGENNLADVTTTCGDNKEGIFFIGVGGDMSVKLFNDTVYGTSNGTRTTDVKKKPAAFNYVEALQGIAQADIMKMTTGDWLQNLADRVGGTYVPATNASGLQTQFNSILDVIINS